MTRDYETEISRAAELLRDTATAAADAIAVEFDKANAGIYAAIFRAAIGDTTGQLGTGTDGRAARWRCRFRFYDNRQPDEPQADSDPELPPNMEGTLEISGLPAVATKACDYAREIHGAQQFVGLDHMTLSHRLKALRPTLSRRGGNATWRIPYDTLETFNEKAIKRGWLCRVDITRVPN